MKKTPTFAIGVLLFCAAVLFFGNHIPAMELMVLFAEAIWFVAFVWFEFMPLLQKAKIFVLLQLVGWITITFFQVRQVVYLGTPLGVFLGLYLLGFLIVKITQFFFRPNSQSSADHGK